jgi:hypothetical protein
MKAHESFSPRLAPLDQPPLEVVEPKASRAGRWLAKVGHNAAIAKGARARANAHSEASRRGSLPLGADGAYHGVPSRIRTGAEYRQRVLGGNLEHVIGSVIGSQNQLREIIVNELIGNREAATYYDSLPPEQKPTADEIADARAKGIKFRGNDVPSMDHDTWQRHGPGLQDQSSVNAEIAGTLDTEYRDDRDRGLRRVVSITAAGLALAGAIAYGVESQSGEAHTQGSGVMQAQSYSPQHDISSATPPVHHPTGQI